MKYRLLMVAVMMCEAACGEASKEQNDAGQDAMDAPGHADVGATRGVCGDCSEDSDCDLALECEKLLNGERHCLEGSPLGRCGRGFIAQVLEPSGMAYCVPETAEGGCRPCLVSGCESEACCLSQGTCSDCRTQCESCQTDLDCGSGLRCSDMRDGFCVVECTSGKECPEGFSCTNAAREVPDPIWICLPLSGLCSPGR
jgi:hypothetical protein